MKKIVLILGLLLAAPALADFTIHLAAARVTIVELKGFSDAEKAKVTEAARLLETTVNGDEFKRRVLAMEFVQTEGLSSQQIHDKIASSTAEFHLAIYTPSWWRRKSEVGHTSPNDPFIHMNRWYFSRFTPAEVAGNLAHEWMHKLGFDHDYKRTPRRPRSVPYAIGELVDELASRLP